MLFWGATGSRTVGIVFYETCCMCDCVCKGRTYNFISLYCFLSVQYLNYYINNKEHIMPREWFAVMSDQTAYINKWLTGDWVNITLLSIVRIKEFYYWSEIKRRKIVNKCQKHTLLVIMSKRGFSGCQKLIAIWTALFCKLLCLLPKCLFYP
jgi:hypothetical protein